MRGDGPIATDEVAHLETVHLSAAACLETRSASQERRCLFFPRTAWSKMYRVLVGGAIVALVLVCMTAALASDIEDVWLSLDGSPTPADEILISVEPDATEATTVVYVGWTPDPEQEPEPPATAEDPESSSALTGVSLVPVVPGLDAEFLPVGGDGTYTIPATSPLPLLLRISGVTDPEPSPGFVLAQFDGVTRVLAQITVTKAAPPAGADALTILGETDTGLNWTITQPNLDAPVGFFNSSDEALEVQLALEPFRTASGQRRETSLSEDAFTLPRGSLKQLTITATNLDHVTTYTSHLIVTVNGTRREPIAVTVERTNPEIFLDLIAHDPVYLSAKTGDVKARASFEAENNGIEPLTVSFRVGKVTRQGANTESTTGVRAIISPVHIEPGSITTVRPTFTGLPVPGHYSVTLQASAFDRSAGSIDLHVYVKRSLGFAIFVFTAAALFGYYATYYLQRSTQRAQRRVLLALLARDFDRVFPTAPSPELRTVYESIHTRLSDLDEDLKEKAFARFDGGLANLRLQIDLLPEWNELRRRAAEQNLSIKELSDVEQMLLKREMDDSQRLAAETLLKAARQRLDAEEHVRPRLESLRQWITVSAAEAESLIGSQDATTETIDEGFTAVQDGDADEAYGKHRDALRAWKRDLINGIRMARGGRGTGLDGRAEWNVAIGEAADSTAKINDPTVVDPEELWKLASTAMRALIDANAAILFDQATDKANGAKAREAATEARSNTLKIDDRWKRLGEASEILYSAVPGSESDGAPPAEDVEIRDIADRGVAQTPSLLRRSIPIPATARLWNRFLEMVGTLIVLALAVLSGLLLEYLNEPAWGDTSDIVAAVFWGFGISAASTFTGYAAFRKTVLGE